MVRHLVDYGRGAPGSGAPNNRRLLIDRDQVWIYRNDVCTMQQRNGATGTQLAAQPGLDCVPLCIQWLREVVEAWHCDPQEWLECDLSRPGISTQHSAVPVPRGQTRAALAMGGPAQMDAAGWERLRM